MEKFKVSFEANNQQLKALGTKHASDTYADIEATFVLGEKWTDMDSVSAVWWNDFTRVATVLDSQGKCIVPHEVLARKGCVRVNLVGSIVEGDELITRLTSYSAEAVQVNEKIKLTGSETSEVTPSQYEQFVANVKADANRAEQSATDAKAYADEAEASAQNASESASASAVSASDSARSATASAGYAQDASESAQSAENAKDDAEDARDEILGMRATAETLEAGSDATASYSDGLLTLGIPRGDRGEQGIQGETGATPNLTIGTVETLEPTESATATITGTAENPVLNLRLPQGRTGEVTYEDLESLLPRDTATGNPITITDGQSVVPAQSLKVALSPIQDLNGYDKPWAGGAGANIWGGERLAEDISEALSIPYDAVTKTIRITISSAADDETINFSKGITFKENTRYTLITDGTAAGLLNMMFKYTDGTTDRSLNRYPQIGAYVSAEGKTVANLVYRSYSGTTVLNYEKCGIFEGVKTVADFTPYSNICPISGHTEVDTQRTGKNLFDKANCGVLNGYISVTIRPSSQHRTVYIPCEPNTTYVSSNSATNRLGLYYCDELPTIGASVSGGSNTITTGANAKYLAWYCWNGTNDTATFDETLDALQIELGSTATDYEPYEADTYTTSLGRTVYGGTLDVVSGELTVDRAMVTLNGTESWTWEQSRNQAYITKNDMARLADYRGSLICDSFETIRDAYISASDYPVGTTGYADSSYPNQNWLYLRNSEWASKADFVSWLTSNPVTVCYELATPQTIQLTPQEVQLLLGANNVWSDGNVTLVYSADIQKWVEKKLNANSTTSMLTMSRPMVQTETTETEETETETAETE